MDHQAPVEITDGKLSADYKPNQYCKNSETTLEGRVAIKNICSEAGNAAEVYTLSLTDTTLLSLSIVSPELPPDSVARPISTDIVDSFRNSLMFTK